MSNIDLDKNAADVVKAIEASDDKEAVLVALADELAKGDGARSTVTSAAEKRVEVLDLPGEVGGSEKGLHGIVLDADGEPLVVDGKHVITDILPPTQPAEPEAEEPTPTP